MKKECTKCDKEKDEKEFYKSNKEKDGRACWCKECRKVYQRKYQEKYRTQAHLDLIENNTLLKKINIKETETFKYITALVKKYDLTNKSRKRECVYRRMAFYNFCRSLDRSVFTLQFIGSFVGITHGSISKALEERDSLVETKDFNFAFITADIEKDLENCPSLDVEIYKTNRKKSVNPIVKLINMVFETEGNQHLKAYINENINPNKL